MNRAFNSIYQWDDDGACRYLGAADSIAEWLSENPEFPLRPREREPLLLVDNDKWCSVTYVFFENENVLDMFDPCWVEEYIDDDSEEFTREERIAELEENFFETNPTIEEVFQNLLSIRGGEK